MFTYRDPLEAKLSSFCRQGTDQSKIRGPAADVADKHRLPRADVLFPPIPLEVHPSIEGGLGFLDNSDVPQSGTFRRPQGELASHLVERCWKGEHHLLLIQGSIRKLPVPSLPNMAKISGTGFDRRNPGYLRGGMPGQKGGLSIHSPMTEP
jgi:hypothetical protein